ncbi:hypothetical protein, partial [Methylobacterium sp. 22177]|uniref:hypothetical protein n=1 Tax=Methylobacterium sp. 22177 TaxID=3453885 RepID=UPI003F836431
SSKKRQVSHLALAMIGLLELDGDRRPRSVANWNKSNLLVNSRPDGPSICGQALPWLSALLGLPLGSG